MVEISFCPYCNASHFKLMLCSKEIFYCKECHRFFKFDGLELKCPKCEKITIRKSDFPSPTGEAVFLCSSCKKSFNASELFKHNKIK